jgi:hypothetical protein
MKNILSIIFFAALLTLTFGSQNGVLSLTVPAAAYASDDNVSGDDNVADNSTSPVCSCGVSLGNVDNDSNDNTSGDDNASNVSGDDNSSNVSGDDNESNVSGDDNASNVSGDDNESNVSGDDNESNVSGDDNVSNDSQDNIDNSSASEAPCTCSDGSAGFWTDGGDGPPVQPGATTPSDFRNLRGQ